MPLPKVAIVGRPNVGKSSLFNWLAGRTIAIVEPTPGVTRDRLVTPIEARGRHFELMDTGGMGIEDVDRLTDQVERQIEVALREASVILFVVDAREGLVPLDQAVAARLRAFDKPILVVANKADAERHEPAAMEFYQLGWPELLCVSTKHNRRKAELLDWIAAHLPPADGSEPEPAPTELKLAIVGRRNTGKSTFINQLAEAERVIVSEVAGTTRDSIDVRFERDGKTFIAIDTAGVRKKSSVANSIEFYSIARAERSIRRADVVLLFFDPLLKISKVDKQVAEYILEHNKPAVFVVNKWDLARPMATGEWADYLRKTFPSLDFVPIAFITAKNGKNVQRVLNLAQSLHKQAGARVGTSRLNRVVEEAVERRQPPLRYNRLPRIFYATQAAVHPPTIVLFTNGPELFDKTYKRYLLSVFRDRLPFTEVPIKMLLRPKGGGRPGGREETEEEAVAKPQAERPKRRRRAAREPELWRDV
jgi:GTP-binding protein